MFKEDQPDVSVIIAAYNSEAFIKTAVNSALNQIGVHVEVIVVDDASTDNTANVVAHIDDPRVTLLRHEKNCWAGVARNTGIDQATGTWLAILDSDDEFAPDRLQNLKAKAEQNQCELVCDNLLIYDEARDAHSEMFGQQQLCSIENMQLADFIQGNMGGEGYSLGYFKPFMKREFLNKHTIRYPVDMNLGEDYFIIADILAAGANCVIDPVARYVYKVRAGSMSYRLAIWDTEKILREEQAFQERHSFDESLKPVLHKRQSYLQHLNAYLRAVDAIKTKSVGRLLLIVTQSPNVLLRLAQSLFKRV